MLSSGNRAIFFLRKPCIVAMLIVLKDLDIVAQYNWKSLINRTATLSFANQAQCFNLETILLFHFSNQGIPVAQ